MGRFISSIGNIRPSQIISTFGPGSIYDNLKDSFLIMGTERWKIRNCKTLKEETLLDYLKKNDNRMYSRLSKFLVPISHDEDDVQIPVRTFPTWGVCPECNKLQRRDRALGDGGVRCQSARCSGGVSGRRNAPETIPVRFVAACKNGHLEDFPWYRWVHRGRVDNCSESEANMVLIDDREHSSLQSKIVRCDNCHRSEHMGQSLSPQGLRFIIPEGCHGQRPWLSTDDSPCQNSEGEQEYLQGIYKGATNLYFSKSVRAITIPPYASRLTDKVIEHLNTVEIAETLGAGQGKMIISELFPESNYDEIMDIKNEIIRRRQSELLPNIRRDEFKELNLRKFGQDGVELDDFNTNPIELPENFSDYLENLVLVRKMREVVAQIGFHRIEPPSADVDYGRPASITNYPEELPEWLPAVENRGEGIFFSLRESKITDWIQSNPSVDMRFEKISARNDAPFLYNDIEPTVKYVLLHSISHLLIREVSNFAGYSISSIRERIYSGDGNMSGVLIYTSSPSSDGSLGGLVEQGKKPKFSIILQRALRKASVCSMDPLCSHSQLGAGNSRLGSACHACMFLPETSCECMNEYLDRALVVDII